MSRTSTPQATRRRFNRAVEAIRSCLPTGWTVKAARQTKAGGALQIVAPNGLCGRLSILVHREFRPRSASALRERGRGREQATIVAARWLSPRTRELLDDLGIGYVDETGNTRLTMDEPGLHVSLEGELRDPSPKPSTAPNLRGPRAWALLRTLAEVQPPYGVSELARLLGIDAGYVSRLLTALSDELLITRTPRGPVQHVEWEAVLRQLTSSYSLLEGNESTSWVASGGPEQFLYDLRASKTGPFAVTGSFAASTIVSATAPEIAVVYSNDAEKIAKLTRLLPVRSGANVVITRPYDRIVFERTWSRGSLTCASVAQVAADCCTGPGRMPAGGDALLEWMRTTAPQWQASSLEELAELP